MKSKTRAGRLPEWRRKLQRLLSAQVLIGCALLWSASAFPQVVDSSSNPLVGSVSRMAKATTASPSLLLNWPNYQLKPRKIAEDTWVIEGAVEDFSKANGCNIINTIALKGTDGVLIINTGPSLLYGEQQMKAMQEAAGAPVTLVWNLNLHPDYLFGNQAYARQAANPLANGLMVGATGSSKLATKEGVTIAALPGTIAGQGREASAYADNLYRLCGDWMRGSEPVIASTPLQPGPVSWGAHRLELLRLSGHTQDDLVVLDHSTGVVFTGGIVFTARAPTTPHANIPHWLASLEALRERLAQFPLKALVPSHGPVRSDLQGLEDTRRYLLWLDRRFTQAAQSGMDMSEVMTLPIPPEIATYAAVYDEYLRNVTHLYPRYEKQAFEQQH